ncbi:MAG: hypothetical protein M3P30_01740 [Chloroflexota bacterium]|nr:hypothetical protein [Chloroflexota bacterium]
MDDDIERQNAVRSGSAGWQSVILRPVTWLWVAMAGLLLVCGGVVLDAYRHNHGATAGSLISSSNPGVLVALCGIALVAIGLLAGLSLIALQSADSPEAVVRKGVRVMVAWVAVIGAGVGALTYVATTDLTIGHAGHTATPVSVAPTASAGTTPAATVGGTGTASTSAPGADQRITLRGTLSLDGVPLNAQFLGARVTTPDGLAAACQAEIPAVSNGVYQITVSAEAEVHGCGASGANVMLWTFPNDQTGFLFTSTTVPWPAGGTRAIAFDASFSAAAPAGASRPATELNGHVTNKAGVSLPVGTSVEAFVGETLCGKSSVRGGEFVGYILVVAGPDAVPGCSKGATLVFRINGQPANETSVNDLGAGANGHDLDLTVP